MVNKVILVGNVGSDPEAKHLDSGQVVVNFSLATSENYKDKNGEKVSKTEWHRIVIWGKLAEVVDKWVKKGSKLYLEGKIVTKQWDDKDGNKRYTTEISVNNMTMLGDGGKKNDEAAPEYKPVDHNAPPENYKPEDTEDLPF